MSFYESGSPPEDQDLYSLLDELREVTGLQGWYVRHTAPPAPAWGFVWPWKSERKDFWRLLRTSDAAEPEVVLVARSKEYLQAYMRGMICRATSVVSPTRAQLGKPVARLQGVEGRGEATLLVAGIMGGKAGATFSCEGTVDFLLSDYVGSPLERVVHGKTGTAVYQGPVTGVERDALVMKPAWDIVGKEVFLKVVLSDADIHFGSEEEAICRISFMSVGEPLSIVGPVEQSTNAHLQDS